MPAPASNGQYMDETFKKVDMTHDVVRESEFHDCRFERCDFAETQFKLCRFVDCEFEDCTLRMTGFDGTSFTGVMFKGCNLLGVDWTQADWSGLRVRMDTVAFADCNLKYNIFLGLDLKKLQMTDCDAREANFDEADLTEAKFKGTDFAEALFRKTIVTGADFVGARHYGFNLMENPSSGARFAMPEALQLLYYLDVKIIDPAADSESE